MGLKFLLTLSLTTVGEKLNADFFPGVIVCLLNFHHISRFYSLLAVAVSFIKLFFSIPLSYFTIRPQDLLDLDHCRLQLTTATIMEAKTKTHQKGAILETRQWDEGQCPCLYP